ncbi:fibronectin type III domain-containing protein [Calditrichota bacterium LG25]
MDTFFDKDYEFPSGRHNVSNYFYEMSKTAPPDKRLEITGEGIYFKLDHTRDWYVSDNKKISDINKDVLLKLDQIDIDLYRFDNWTFGQGQQNHQNTPDGKIDLVYIIYRNVYNDNPNYQQLIPKKNGTQDWSGLAGLDFSGTLYLPNNGIYAKGSYCSSNSSGITIVKFRRYFDETDFYASNGGHGRYLHLFLHELGHFLLGGVHEYESGVSALMGLNENAGYTMSPYEREKLGWINPSSITSDTQIQLHDYVNTGEVIKIDQGAGKYIYVANHQFQNLFDHPNGNYDQPGIYITKKGSTSSNGRIFQFSAKGNFNWQYKGQFDNPWGNPGDKIPAWDWIKENPTEKSYLDALKDPDNNKDKVQHIYYDDNHQLIMDHSIHRAWGLTEDVFDAVPGKDMLSKFTNPSILAYNGGSDQYGIQIVSQNNGVYTINVYTSLQSVIDNLPPFRPLNFSATLSGNTITINWDANSEPDFNRYEIYRSYNSTSGFSNIKNIYDINTTNYNDQNFQPSTSGFVYYKMRVKDNSSKYSVFTRVKGFDIPPDVPQNFHIVSVSYGVVEHPKLIWNANIENDLSGYKIERRINNGNWQVVHTASPSETYWTDMEISRQKSNNYDNAYYRMRAFDGSNHYSQYTATQTYWFSEGGGPMNEKGKSPVVALPKTEILFNNSPNPFNPTTTIKFGLPEDGYVQLTIYSMSGQKVCTLLDGQVSKGYHQIVWDGKNESGQAVSGGLYFYELRTNHKRILKKMLLVK